MRIAEVIEIYRQAADQLHELPANHPRGSGMAAQLGNVLKNLPEDLRLALVAETCKRLSPYRNTRRVRRVGEWRRCVERVDQLVKQHERQLDELDQALSILRTAPRLTWSRDERGIYWAEDGIHHFCLVGGGGWTVGAYRIADQGEAHSSDHVTFTQARDAVQAFVDLGENYRPEDHDGRSRWREAIWRACERAAQ